MQRSAFPTTSATVLLTLAEPGVADAERAKLAQNARCALMSRYAEPLAAFVRGSSLARLGEPEEIVNGFLAARLSDDAAIGDFLSRWSASGMRLRRWLMNGILFYGQGLARDRARAQERGGPVAPHTLDRREGAATTGESDFERAWALAAVREATARAEAELLAEGRAVEFEIFRRHAIDGQPYAVFARELGRSEQQCAGATRLVAQRVRAAVADLLREEGVDEPELEDEVARMHRWLADPPRG
jgi:hypothetical protein